MTWNDFTCVLISRFNVYRSDNRLCTFLNENNDQVRYAKVLVMVAPWDKLKPLKIGLRSSEAFFIKGKWILDFDFGKLFRYKLFLVLTDRCHGKTKEQRWLNSQTHQSSMVARERKEEFWSLGRVNDEPNKNGGGNRWQRMRKDIHKLAKLSRERENFTVKFKNI